MSKHTPTTEAVKAHYALGMGQGRPESREPAFDRWLRQVKAEAWEAGYLVGTGDGFNRSQGNRADNPHKEATT